MRSFKTSIKVLRNLGLNLETVLWIKAEDTMKLYKYKMIALTDQLLNIDFKIYFLSKNQKLTSRLSPLPYLPNWPCETCKATSLSCSSKFSSCSNVWFISSKKKAWVSFVNLNTIWFIITSHLSLTLPSKLSSLLLSCLNLFEAVENFSLFLLY